MIPEPPKEKVVIPQEDCKRLEAWVSFFKGVSPRLRVVKPADKEFAHFFLVAKRRAIQAIDEDYELQDWPNVEDVAFGLAINSAEPGADKEVHETDDVYLFCFGGIAFSLTYFQWDGDAEIGHHPNTYSLSRWEPDTISWNFIKQLIVEKVEELEKRVPPLS